MNSGNDLSLLPLRLGRHANMENIDYDWLNGNWASNLEFPISDSPRAGTVAEPASQAAELVDEPGGEHALPLL
jgi:hypothetical protein